MSAVDVRHVLADPAQSGAYFVDARETDALIDAARALDYSVTRIDLEGCRDKASVLDRMARALRFPAWFGANFDALSDSLNDLSWLPADGYLLMLEDSDAWRQSDDDNFATLLDILNETSARWGDIGKPFWTLMPLPEQELSKLTL